MMSEMNETVTAAGAETEVTAEETVAEVTEETTAEEKTVAEAAAEEMTAAEKEAAPKKTRGRKPAAKTALKEEAPKKTRGRKPAAKAAEKEETPKKTRGRKAAAETAATEDAPKKARGRKAAAEPAAEPKRRAGRKPAVKEPVASVTIQFGGSEYAAKEILAAAKDAFTKNHEGVEIETIDIYVKPEEGAAYYVVNGVGGDDMKIEL